MLLSAKKEGGRGGVIFMTSNDLVIPAGIRLRIPSLLVFPDQVSCGEKPKATVFPFCSRGAALRLMSISEEHEKKNVLFFFRQHGMKSIEICGSVVVEAKKKKSVSR